MIKKTRTIRSIITLTFSTTLLLINSSCNVLDKAEPTPSYIYLDKFEVQTNSDNSQGSGAADIVDGWLFVDG